MSPEQAFSRTEVIYGRRHGLALTLEAFVPRDGGNGAGVILFLSEGWVSDPAMIDPAIPGYVLPLIGAGFTVFAVIHGSAPKYSIPECIGHAQLAVRYLREQAARFRIDPGRLGAIGDSAGGHLSLLVGGPAAGDAQVSAVVAFFPPVDFLNWSGPGTKMLGEHPLVPLHGAFRFHRLDEARSLFEPITDAAERERIAREISPITHVQAGAAPTLIVVGDADEFIPPQQSIMLAERLTAAGATAQLIMRPGGGHDMETISAHLPDAIRWFRRHLTGA